MHHDANSTSVLTASTLMVQTQLRSTCCRRTFADSTQGVKPGRDFHVRQSESFSCLRHHMVLLIRCALLCSAQPCHAPVLPCPSPVPALPLLCSAMSFSLLSHTVLQLNTMVPLQPALPSGVDLCHTALGRLTRPCPQNLTLSCPAALQRQALHVLLSCAAYIFDAFSFVRRVCYPYRPSQQQLYSF